ncbi:MAG TPA: hypothetical protein VFQ22_03310, partial [Longimicrobiales bacterium]|nr:hypothetical protein [Longimicrobiales bacterium]
MRSPRAERGRRAFLGLLLLYPRWFREEHGEEMTQLFMARMERARGRVARLALWWRTIVDAAWSAGALRRDDWKEGATGMGSSLQDVRTAARRLIRSPVFTASVVALLAIGIGASTTAFTVVDALLFRAPPWSE